MSPDLLEAARALRDEVRELRSAVREVVAILENWERRPPKRSHAVRRRRKASRRHPPPMMARPERTAHKNGGRIGRIVTPCRTPDPALRPGSGGRYYLNVPKYAHMRSMSQHVGTGGKR